MNEKKDLDRLFQEKFKDFEVAPPEFVWENIQEILQEKKKRRVIPLWFKLSGVAALLVLSGLLATLFFNNAENPINTNPVVIDNNTASPADALKASPNVVPANAAIPTIAKDNSSNNTTTPANTNAAANSPTAVATTSNITTGTAGTLGNTTPNNSAKSNRALPANNSNTAVAQQNRNRANNNSTGNRNNSNISQGDAVVYQSTEQSQTAIPKTGQVTNSITSAENNTGSRNADETIAAARLRNNAKNFANDTNPTQTKANRNNSIPTPATEGIAASVAERVNKESAQIRVNAASNTVIAPNNKTSQGIADNSTQNTQNADPANAENNTMQKSNAIVDKNIPVTETVAQITIDTTATLKPENELEKLLQEKMNGKKDEKALTENTPKERWILKPQVAPVFYNSLTSGSPINEQFAANSKSYDNDLSFGLGINYAVTDRITIRSGINSVNLSYATNDISFYPSLNSATSNIGVSKAANIVVQNGNAVPETVMIDGQPTQAVSGSMLQKTGYIEIPLEMSYSVVNKKFGIDVIGGVSSLFLNQNNVSVVSNTGLSTRVGEAQNLNNLHFSTNIGLGFKYHFWDSFQVNFEPMFKYQLNAYSENSGNFKPYFIGLYSGVSFSF